MSFTAQLVDLMSVEYCRVEYLFNKHFTGHVFSYFSCPICWVIWVPSLHVRRTYVHNNKIKCNNNNNIIKCKTFESGLRVKTSPHFPPKRNHDLVIWNCCDMDQSLGLEHANTFYQGHVPQ